MPFNQKVIFAILKPNSFLNEAELDNIENLMDKYIVEYDRAGYTILNFQLNYIKESDKT